MNQKPPLNNRSERKGNLVPIEAYDNTSRAYSKDSSERPQTGFSAYLAVAVIVFLVVFFIGIYELVVETWVRLK